MGTQLYKTGCPLCQAKGGDTGNDNMSVFEDGTYCWVCKTSTRTEGGTMADTQPQPPPKAKPGRELITAGITYEALPHRKISRETCLKYGYGVVEGGKNKWEIAPYYDRETGNLKAQKGRLHGTQRSNGANVSKVLTVFGDGKEKTFFGKHLVPAGGPMLVITEGELDAMSVYEANGLKYPAVSIPDGVSSAAKVVASEVEYVNSFERVVFMFDNDEAGRAAAIEAASVLRPGKAYIAKLTEKDANDCLLANKKAELCQAVWKGEPYRPDGIVHAKDVSIESSARGGKIYTYPHSDITKATFGRHTGDVTMLTSGTGMGKSTFVREMIYYDLSLGYNVGAIMLEEGVAKTKQDIMSVHLSKPIHKILASRTINDDLLANGLDAIDFGSLPALSEEELVGGKKWIDESGLYLYDHFGSLETEVLQKRIEFLHYACGCDLIYLDHVSIVVSGNDGDERRELDKLMTALKSIAERTGVVLTAVCHLRKAGGTSFEQGGQISLDDLRGSGSLKQLADTVLGFERDQQHEDPLFANTMGIRLLKDRFGGNTGLKAAMRFDQAHHKLLAADVQWYRAKQEEKKNARE